MLPFSQRVLLISAFLLFAAAVPLKEIENGEVAVCPREVDCR